MQTLFTQCFPNWLNEEDPARTLRKPKILCQNKVQETMTPELRGKPSAKHLVKLQRERKVNLYVLSTDNFELL